MWTAGAVLRIGNSPTRHFGPHAHSKEARPGLPQARPVLERLRQEDMYLSNRQRLTRAGETP